jgi:hypothetical protein
MQHKLCAVLLVVLVLLMSTSAWAIPLTGFVEGTASNGWLGAFAVQLMDGTVTTGTSQIFGFPEHGFQSLPLTGEGCTPGTSGCYVVQNLLTSTTLTLLNTHFLNLAGSATLGSLGSVSWGTQGIALFPGDPAPTAAALATVTGLGLTRSSFSFGFNGTLTASFASVNGGQALSALRVDFADATAPRTLRAFFDGTTFVNNGVPVALGTQLAVPEPSPLLLLSLSIAGLLWWPWKRIDGQ